MATGKVKWYNPQKGFGFIEPDDGTRDVFVHATALEAAGINGLTDNQAITYEVANDRGKPAATELRVTG